MFILKFEKLKCKSTVFFLCVLEYKILIKFVKSQKFANYFVVKLNFITFLIVIHKFETLKTSSHKTIGT